MRNWNSLRAIFLTTLVAGLTLAAGAVRLDAARLSVRLSAHAEGSPKSHVEAQEPDPIVTWQILVNEARLDEGLAPYGFSTLLTAAAQRHADDLAAHQSSSHTGSDGSTPQQRIAEAGYAAWTRDGGESVASENFWAGHGTIEDAIAFFLEHPSHRDNILSDTYREIGIGAATDADGRNYYVLDFGARPNVLPIFVNDGAASTDTPQIAIRLTNEETRPGGQGTIFMGRAIEMRINDEPNFDDRAWQPWEPLVPWTLPDTPGEHTVYVQLRDAAGRTAASADAIFLGEGTPATPTPAQPSPTPEPAATTIPEPTAVLAPIATFAPEPPPATEPPPTLSTPGPSPPAPIITPFPTWTPLPTATPPQEEEPATLDAPLVTLAALQGIVLVLGLYLALRRGRNSDTGQ